MEIINLHREFQVKQLDFVGRYLDFYKEMQNLEIKLNGQISQTDLLLNKILEQAVNLENESILEEANNLYERVLLKKYARNVLSNNTAFQNIFKSKNIDEIEKRTNIFLEKNKQLLEESKNIEMIINQINGDENGTKEELSGT